MHGLVITVAGRQRGDKACRLCPSQGVGSIVRNRNPARGRSKLADEFKGVDFDLVVTVCDSAAEECPVWLGKGKRVHHSFPDPAKAEGTDEDDEDFRNVRDDIEKSDDRIAELTLLIWRLS